MNLKIFKYTINNYRNNLDKIKIEGLVEVLDIQFQNNEMVLWALIDEDKKITTDVTILSIGTGIDFDEFMLMEQIQMTIATKYFKTLQEPGTEFVWHLFTFVKWK